MDVNSQAFIKGEDVEQKETNVAPGDADFAMTDSISADTETDEVSLPQTEEEMRHCKHCDFQAEDWPMFAKHSFKPAHLKKLAEAYSIQLCTEPQIYKCDVCAVECKAHKPWMEHLMGARHKKAIELLYIAKATEKDRLLNSFKNTTGGPMRNNQYGSLHNKKPYDRMQQNNTSTQALAAKEFAEFEQPLIGLEYVTEIQVAGQAPRYECSVCDTKLFDNNIKFPHLVGQKHRINVLQIKRPEALKGVNQATTRRSEMTVILTREASKLEQEEGRKEVRTKVLSSAASYKTDYSRQNLPGRGGARGTATRGSRGTFHGGRGVSRGVPVNTRGSPGVGSGGRGNSGYTSRVSRGSWSNRGVTHPSGGYNMRESIAGSNPPNSTGLAAGSSYTYEPYSYVNDSYAQYYGVSSNSSFADPNYMTNYQESFASEQAYSTQTYAGCGPQFSAGVNPQSMPAPTHKAYPESMNVASKKPDAPQTKEGVSPGLAAALGDLTKLVQNEDDASVALQVSNALTQALLQYRITSEG